MGSSSVAITRMVVVLPAPLGPMKPKHRALGDVEG
jgi:hypothetical protein